MSEQLALFANPEKPRWDVPESEWQPCQVCGKPVCPWGKPGTVEGLHCFFGLVQGEPRLCYYGSVHDECQRLDWPRQLDHAVSQGWLAPTGDGGYKFVR